MVDYGFLPDIEAVASTELQILHLADGRDLAFTQWGDADGFPVFYFHGTPSSRFEGAFADAAARHHRLCLIAIDRPGFGRSTFQPHRRFAHWPTDVLALADDLKIDRFGVAGHSGAGPHLFACGARIDQKRLAFIGALGPWGPVASTDVGDSLNRLDRAFANAARKRPWLMRVGFAPVAWAARWSPRLFFGMMKRSVSPPDRLALEDPNVAGIFRAMLCEAFRQGNHGAAYEAYLAYTEWGFAVEAVQVPTHIWLGEEDIFVPNAMGNYLKRHISDVDFHWVAGAGHLNIENWEEIFAACRKSLDTAP